MVDCGGYEGVEDGGEEEGGWADVGGEVAEGVCEGTVWGGGGGYY